MYRDDISFCLERCFSVQHQTDFKQLKCRGIKKAPASADVVMININSNSWIQNIRISRLFKPVALHCQCFCK